MTDIDTLATANNNHLKKVQANGLNGGSCERFQKYVLKPTKDLKSAISVWRTRPDAIHWDNEHYRKKFQNRIERIYPPAYASNIPTEQEQLEKQVREAMEWALVMRDNANITTALNLVKTYYVMKYPANKDLLESLVADLFILLIEDCDNQLLTKTSLCSILFNILRVGRHSIDVVIEWRPLYKIYKEAFNMPDKESTYNFLNEVDISKFKTNLNELIVTSRPFFSIDSFKEIQDESHDMFCPHSISMFHGTYLLAYFLPTHHLYNLTECPKWIYEYFTIWELVENNPDWNERWIYIFSRLVKHAPKIDWNPLAPRIYSHCLKIIDLSIGNPIYSHLKATKHTVPPSVKIAHEECLEYTFMGIVMVSLFKHNTMNLFKRLFSSIITYYHPSNQGDHTMSLLEFLSSTCHSFVKRHLRVPFSQEILDQFIETVFPAIISTLYNKNKNYTLNACKILKEIAYISPKFIFDRILDRLYGSGNREEEVNRLISDLESVSTCFHPLISSESYPEGISHVYNLMEIAMNSMDPIYPNKSSAAFKFLNRIFTCIPLNDETVYTDQEVFANEFERQASLSSASFLDWSLLFIDKLLAFIKSAATKKDNLNDHKRKTPPGTFLIENVDLFFNQLSDDIFDAVLEKLVHFFSKSYYPDYYKQYSLFLKSATLRSPSKSLNTFLPVFINKIFKHTHDGYQIKDLSDEEYRWYISLIGYTVIKSGNALPEHKDTLINICKILMESDNKVIIKQTSKIIRKAIYSLTRYYPSNNTSIPMSLFSDQKSHIKYWGSTNEDCFPIEWFQPNENTIQMAKELIQIFLVDRVKQLQNYTSEIEKNNTLYNRNILYNHLKSIFSILRTAVYVMNDDDLEPVTANINKFTPTLIPISFGRIIMREYDGLTREIYEIVHKLLGYIEQHKNDEIIIMKVISKVYMALQYGKKDIHDRNSDVLFGKWKNLKKLKTRDNIIYKGYKEHLARQTIFYDKSPLTKCCKLVLDDLLKLSINRYKIVRKVAQEAIIAVSRRHVGATQSIVPKLLDIYVEQKNDEEICGVVHLLLSKQMSKVIKTNWLYFTKLVKAFLTPLDPKLKPNTKFYVLHFKQELLLSKSEPSIFKASSKIVEGTEENHSIVPLESIQKQKSVIETKNKEHFEAMEELIRKIVDTLDVHQKQDNLAWREHIIFQSYLGYVISTYTKQVSKTIIQVNPLAFVDHLQIFKTAFEAIFLNMNNDYPISRILSVNTLSYLQTQDKTYFEQSSEHFWKHPVGTTPSKKPIFEQAARLFTTMMTANIKQLLTPTFLEKILKYFAQDNEVEGQNIAISLSSKHVSPLWPNTRHPLLMTGLKIQFAKLFNLFTQMDDKFLDLAKPHLLRLRGKSEKEDQFLLAEMIAGIGRYYTVTPDTPRTKEALELISEVLYHSLSYCSNEINDTWSTAIRYISHNTKVERLGWLIELLFKLNQNPSNIFTLSKSLKFLRSLLFELSYKSKDYLARLLVICEKEFSNPYKQVRDENFKLYCNVLVYLTEYQDNDGNLIIMSPPKLPSEAIASITSLVASATNPDIPTETKLLFKETLIETIDFAFSRGYSNSLMRIIPILLPPILTFTGDTNHDIMKISIQCLAAMAQGYYFDQSIINELLNVLKNYASNSWRSRRSIQPFLQIFFFNHALILTPEQKELVFQIVIQATGDPQIEVREFARDTLQSILMTTKLDHDRVQNLISTSIKELSSSKISNENILQKHKYILILSAIVLSSPYQIPSYFPRVLDQMTRYRSAMQPIRGTVQTTLADFWRTHKETWEEEKLKFDENEIEMINDTVAYPSYYA